MARIANPKTPQWTTKERAIVRRFFAMSERLGLNYRDVEMLLRMSSATISQLRNEKYTGAVGRITNEMLRTMARWRERLEVLKPVEFVRTGVAEEVYIALRVAHVRGDISMILGPAGVGKTMAVREYCKEEPETVYIACGPGSSPKALLKVLAGNLKEGYRGTQLDMRQKVAQKLKGTGQLVVFDDADWLPETTLQHLRLIHDMTGVGMAFVGTEAYMARLKEQRSQTINQFLSRVGLEVRLPSLRDEDLDMIGEQFGLGEEALAVLHTDAYGQARRAVKALQNALALDSGQRVSAKNLRTAFRQLPRLL